MDDEIVPYDELADLCGWKTAKKVREWLTANRIDFINNARGRPIVARSVIMRALGVSIGKEVPPPTVGGINIGRLEAITSRK